MRTDVDAVFEHWGAPGQSPIRRIAAAESRQRTFAAGSMGPKVQAACDFAETTGATVGIGALKEALQFSKARPEPPSPPGADPDAAGKTPPLAAPHPRASPHHLAGGVLTSGLVPGHHPAKLSAIAADDTPWPTTRWEIARRCRSEPGRAA